MRHLRRCGENSCGHVSRCGGNGGKCPVRRPLVGCFALFCFGFFRATKVAAICGALRDARVRVFSAQDCRLSKGAPFLRRVLLLLVACENGQAEPPQTKTESCIGTRPQALDTPPTTNIVRSSYQPNISRLFSRLRAPVN